MDELYKCNSCKVEQPEENFYVSKTGEIKRRCNSCEKGQRKVIRKLRREHPYPYCGEGVPLPNWFSFKVHKYTNSPDYTCPICEKTMQELYAKKQEKLKVWVLDHCHETNTFRGWLCHNCNVKVGNEKKKFFTNAIKYLKNHKEIIDEVNT